VAGVELKSGEAHSSYTMHLPSMKRYACESLGNWLIRQNIDSQIAERMILLRSNDYFHFAFLGNTTK
jgi:hypothetical protein